MTFIHVLDVRQKEFYQVSLSIFIVWRPVCDGGREYAVSELPEWLKGGVLRRIVLSPGLMKKH